MTAVLHAAATGALWAVIAAVAAAWIVSAFALGALIGKVIRNANRQVPRDRR